MASGFAPDTLTDRHRLLAQYVVMGWSNIRCAEELSMHPNRVAAIKSSPLFQAVVERLRREQEQIVAATHADRLVTLRGKAWDRHEVLMQQDENLGVAARMVEAVIDRTDPKKSITESESTVRFVIDASLADAMRQALADDTDADVVDITPTPLRQRPERPPVVVRSVDDIIAESADELTEDRLRRAGD